MRYDSFTLHRVMQSFRVTVDASRDLFGHVSPVSLAADTQSVIVKNTPLALLTHTEKARSELLAALLVAEWQRFSLLNGSSPAAVATSQGNCMKLPTI